MECFNCGHKGYLEKHHVVPRSLGGTKTILLCAKCHGLAHGNGALRNDNHANLIKKGIERRKKEGKIIGRPTKQCNEKLIVRVTESQKNDLMFLAKEENVSFSELIRRSIDEIENDKNAIKKRTDKVLQ